MKPPRIIRNKLLRKKVFERDGGICIDCKRYDRYWEHDHDLALWNGGPDTLENSVTRCRRCHLAKTVAETPIRAKTDRLRARSELTERRKPTVKRGADAASPPQPMTGQDTRGLGGER